MAGTPSSRWQDLTATADAIASASEGLELAARRQAGTPAEIDAAREALEVVTAAGNGLARQLDALSNRFSEAGAALVRPSEVHVALDQAAAAAEDLSHATRVAAQAIADQQER
ncbi:hypothetical protein [Saccharopolyspora taberi]|uniref:PE domain-containing protein n=1 Tax=Saccharopolyspora taberi TaxID=60895 RepID=A0ABN3VET9_9PSEU